MEKILRRDHRSLRARVPVEDGEEGPLVEGRCATHRHLDVMRVLHGGAPALHRRDRVVEVLKRGA